MGRIHDALERAEQERAERGAAPSAASGPRQLVAEPAPARPRTQTKQRRERIRSARRAKIMVSGPASMVTDEYRSLRARIQSVRRARPFKSLVITSAVPGEGKTTTATNLALSMGLERDARTCLVDADLRTPSVHLALSEEPIAGLAELLEADAKLEEALVQVPDTRLWTITVRALPTNPSELLTSQRMIDLLAELESRFDTIIVDAPPVLGLPDATQLVDLCDGVLLVVNSGGTPRGQVASTLERIDQSKVLGTVMNRVSSVPKPYGYGS